MGFRGDERGFAAVEFALLLPVLMLLFFGMLEGSDLFTVDRRVANASNALVDLIAQEINLTEDEMDDIIVGAERLLNPINTSSLTISVLSLTRGAGEGEPVRVHWSIDRDGGEPYAPGSIYDKLSNDNAVRPEASLIIVEMTYTYDSGLTSQVFRNPYQFNTRTMRVPRRATRIQLCETDDVATCTT